MHRTLTTLGSILLVQITFAQSQTLKLSEDPTSNLGCIEFPPKYPGGYAAMQKLFVKSMRYPEAAEKEGIEGKVIIQYAVDTLGNTINIKVFKGVCYELDLEAARLIKLLNEWIPATLNGKKIIYYFNQPFTFCATKD